jgi:CubicO group peptidase (beta-lactamase class C family)
MVGAGYAEPDAVVFNAKVCTVEPGAPRAEAFAVKGGRFLAVRVVTGLTILCLLTPIARSDSPAMRGGTTDAGVSQCAALGLSKCPIPFDPVVPAASDMLSWGQSDRVVGFRNTYRQYKADVFHADPAHLSPLAISAVRLPPIHYEMAGRTWGLEDYLRHQSVTGLLVLQEGRIVYEHYGGGNTDSTLWTSRSVAKSIVSVLVGMAIKEGRIRSVDDAITQYLPELKQTSWDGVSLRNLMQHTSGVEWNENYADPESDFARLTRCEARADDAYECVLKLVRSVARKPNARPGEVWSYNTGGAWLVGRVLESATGMSIVHYLESRLWRPLGMESDGVWEALVPGRIDMGGHGFNATLRDWGRFGWFVARGGRLPDGRELLPQDWLMQSTQWTRARGSVTKSTPDGQYGYQWWHLGPAPGSPDTVRATTDRTMWALGIYGQAIAIDSTRKRVMVQWSTYKEADPDELSEEQVLFFNAIEQALE